MTTIHPLPEAESDRIVAWCDGRPVSRARFVAEVLTLAPQLPRRGQVLNLCQDRYRFTVALFAALLQDTLTVLPNSEAPEHLASLVAAHPGLQVLNDRDRPAPADCPLTRVDRVALAATTAATLPPVPFDRLFASVHTSGSTGAPTAHRKQFGRMRLAILAGAERLWRVAGGPCSVLGTVPIRHMYGLEASVLLPVLAGGCLSNRLPFFPADIADSLAQMPAPRLLVITPFHLRKLLDADIALPPVAAVLSATAPLPADLAADAERRLGCPVVEIYGSTETGQLAMREPCRDTLWHTLAGTTLSQQGDDTWACGEVYPEPQRLNDRLELHGPSAFRLVDRKANMINVAGKRSSLSFLNTLLQAQPGVRDGVFCVPWRDDHRVERLAAFVVAPGVSRQAILAGLRAHIDPVFLPRPLVFVEALERDGNGKLPARTLAALIARHIPPLEDAR